MKIDMTTADKLTIVSNSTSGGGSHRLQIYDVDFKSEEPYDVDLASLNCDFFLMAKAGAGSLDGNKLQSPTITKSQYAGQVMFVMVANNLGYVREFRHALVNHVAYAQDYGYGLSVALITSDILQWRSPKYGKHYAIGQLSSVR